MKSIFKYMPHYNGEFFKTFILRATQRMDLNDPFEFLPTKDLYESVIGYAEQNSDLNWFNSITYEVFCSSFFPSQGVISFTETKSNLLMWAHYAQGHKGLVVEFDVSNDFFLKMKRVNYDNIKPSQAHDLNELFFYKSDEWIYEKEHRIVKDLVKHDFFMRKSDMKMNTGKQSVFVNPLEVEEMYFFSIPKNSLKSVTFGCMIDKGIKEKIKSIVRGDPELVNVEFWQTKLSKEYFYLEFEKVIDIKSDTNSNINRTESDELT